MIAFGGVSEVWKEDFNLSELAMRLSQEGFIGPRFHATQLYTPDMLIARPSMLRLSYACLHTSVSRHGWWYQPAKAKHIKT